MYNKLRMERQAIVANIMLRELDGTILRKDLLEKVKCHFGEKELDIVVCELIESDLMHSIELNGEVVYKLKVAVILELLHRKQGK